MKLQVLIAFTTLFAEIQAKHPNPWRIPEFDIAPFGQEPPSTDAEKAAEILKPHITRCFAFPAVDSVGHIGAGLNTSETDCVVPSSDIAQVYGRSEVVDDRLAIMFAYYFRQKTGSPHSWQSIVVFIENQDVLNPKILSCSLSVGNDDYTKHEPCPMDNIDGNRVMVFYETGSNQLILSKVTDIYSQNLIMWDHLTDEARSALNDDAGYPYVPLNEKNFQRALESASSHIRDSKPRT